MSDRLTYFTVRGQGNFPFELLFREECWPASADDADKILYACPTQTERVLPITFAKYGPVKEPGRWKEKKWPVVRETTA